MKLSILISTVAACDVSSNVNFINYKQDMGQIDNLIQQYFELDVMNQRKRIFDRIPLTLESELNRKQNKQGLSNLSDTKDKKNDSNESVSVSVIKLNELQT